ncbi:MAG: ATP-grasp domain-containing protein [Planctomycetaceae bacterium]|nr:ATP-grasp domain-containing protein [Planctomycetaceae bacterium]
MWLIERDVFEPSMMVELIGALNNRGASFRQFAGTEPLDDGSVLQMTGLHASCWFVTQAAHSRAWPSSTWGTPGDFSVTAYRQRWRAWLLNADAESLSLGEFLWKRQEVWHRWQDDSGRLFVRPDDGFKTFTGSLLSLSGLEIWWEARQAFMTPTHTRIWVSHPQPIHEEYRVFVVDGRVVTASQYRPGIALCENCELAAFVEAAVSDVQPIMRMLAVDVASTDEGLRVVEIGCIPCLDFYAANLMELTAAIEID